MLGLLMDGSREPDREAALRAALNTRGFAYSRIVGTSMLPTLASGDIILIRPCGTPRPGDVVTFVRAGRLITHRLVFLDDTGLVCRGDNRLHPDSLVPSHALIGRVAEVVGRPAPGRTSEFLNVRVRWRWKEAAARLARLRDQVDLVTASLADGPHPYHGRPPIFGLVRGMADSGLEHVVSHAELVDPDILSRLGPGTAVVLPASLYGSLPPAQRRHLVSTLSGTRIDAFGVPRESAGRAVRALTHARRLAGRLGLSAGEPGDVAARGIGGEPYVLHTFTAAELATELREAGLEGVQVATVNTESGPMLHAWGAPRRARNPAS
jgi:hypothetical protein